MRLLLSVLSLLVVSSPELVWGQEAYPYYDPAKGGLFRDTPDGGRDYLIPGTASSSLHWDPFGQLSTDIIHSGEMQRQAGLASAQRLGNQQYAAMWQAIGGMHFPSERELNLKVLQQSLPACRFTPTKEGGIKAVQEVTRLFKTADGKPVPAGTPERLFRLYYDSETQLHIAHNDFVAPMFVAFLISYKLFNGDAPLTMDSRLFLCSWLHSMFGTHPNYKVASNENKQKIYFSAGVEAAYLQLAYEALANHNPVAIKFLQANSGVPTREAARNEARRALTQIGVTEPEKWHFTPYGFFEMGKEQAFVHGWRPIAQGHK